MSSGQEQEQELLVNTAPPQLPKLCLHKFSLQTRGQQQGRDDVHLVNGPNQTGCEMMSLCSRAVWCVWAIWGKGGTLLLQSYYVT